MTIELNKNNGDVIIGDLKITSKFSVADIEGIKPKYDVIFDVEHGDNSFYRIPFLENGESAVGFQFKKGKLCNLNIAAGFNFQFPPFVITDEERKVIRDKIALIGGEYSWGSVSYNEDNKGGSVSILIKYNNNKETSHPVKYAT